MYRYKKIQNTNIELVLSMKTIELEKINKRNCFRGSCAIRYSLPVYSFSKRDLVAALVFGGLSGTTRRREFRRRHRQCQRVKATDRSCNYSSSLLGRVESVTGSSRTRPTLSLRAIFDRSRVHSRETSIDERWTIRTIAQHQLLRDNNRPDRTTLN